MHNVFVLCKANLAMSRNLGLFLTSILPSKIRYNHANMIMKEITVFMKTNSQRILHRYRLFILLSKSWNIYSGEWTHAFRYSSACKPKHRVLPSTLAINKYFLNITGLPNPYQWTNIKQIRKWEDVWVAFDWFRAEAEVEFAWGGS